MADENAQQEPSKSEVAEILGKHLVSLRISEKARGQLEDLAWWFVTAREEDVRQVMAGHLVDAPALKQKTIERVIKDESEAVAAPFIEATQHLSEQQWLALMADLEEHALAAVARREDLTEDMAVSLVTHGQERTVNTLVNNKTAPVNERVCDKVVARFGDDKVVMRNLAQRPDLSHGVAQTLARYVGDGQDTGRFRSRSYEPPQTPRHDGEGRALGGSTTEKERRYDTVTEDQLIDRLVESGSDNLAENIKRLAGGGRISDEFILAAAERHDLTICSLALAQRAHMQPNRVHSHLRSGDLKAFREVFQRGKIRKELWAPIAGALTSGAHSPQQRQ